MKIIGCLSWYEESPIWLASLIASTADLVDEWVAVDGAYFLYPEALQHPNSGPEQAEAIIQTAKATGAGCTIHVPNQPWMGNETQKRTYLFQLATLQTTNDDWLLIMDGDDIIDHTPEDIRQRLQNTDLHVAEVSLTWREDWELTSDKQTLAHRMNTQLNTPPPDRWAVNHRALVRALPNLRCGYAHMIYEANLNGDTIRLRGQLDNDHHPLEPALNLTDLRIEHRHTHRNPARQQAANDYYELRDSLGVELSPKVTA